MQIKSVKKLLAAAALAGLTISGYRIAAQNPADNGGGAPQAAQGGRRGGPGGGFGNFDPSQITDMMVENYHETLQPTDDEWAVIKPLLTNVVKLQMTQTARPMGMGMMGRRGGGQGGPGGPGGQGGPGGPGGGPGGPGGGFGGPGGPGGPGGGFGAMFGETDPTQQALSDAVNADAPSADAVKAKLEAYRAAQAKKAAELKAAREKLRAVLSIIQEAKLVLSGVLD